MDEDREKQTEGWIGRGGEQALENSEVLEGAGKQEVTKQNAGRGVEVTKVEVNEEEEEEWMTKEEPRNVEDDLDLEHVRRGREEEMNCMIKTFGDVRVLVVERCGVKREQDAHDEVDRSSEEETTIGKTFIVCRLVAQL